MPFVLATKFFAKIFFNFLPGFGDNFANFGLYLDKTMLR